MLKTAEPQARSQAERYPAARRLVAAVPTDSGENELRNSL